MTTLLTSGAFTALDLAALAFLIVGWLVFGHFVEHPPKGRTSVAVLVDCYRREWMRQFVTRQPRIFDATVIDSLRQATSFLASATLIALGGGLALVGNMERFRGVAEDLALAHAPEAILEAKVLLVVLFLTNACLKFIWAHRLFGYCAIVMAAVPNDPADPLAFPRAAQAAEVNSSAAKAFNRGLRSVYFALAALAWLLGPLALLLGTLATLAVLSRREFASQSRRVLMQGTPK